MKCLKFICVPIRCGWHEVFEVHLHSDKMWLTLKCLKFICIQIRCDWQIVWSSFVKRIKLTKGVCKGLWCYAASPKTLFSFFEKTTMGLPGWCNIKPDMMWLTWSVWSSFAFRYMYPTCNWASQEHCD